MKHMKMLKIAMLVLAIMMVLSPVLADAPITDTLTTTFESPLPGEWPPVPPIDLGGINEYVALAGLSTVIMMVVEVLKRLGVVPDNQAARWTSLGNIVGFAVLSVVGVFGIDFATNTDIQNVLDLLTRIGQGILAILGSPLLFNMLRQWKILTPLAKRTPCNEVCRAKCD